MEIVNSTLCLIYYNVVEFNTNLDLFNNDITEIKDFVNNNVKTLRINRDYSVQIIDYLNPSSDHK
jgi:hypothetical protein